MAKERKVPMTERQAAANALDIAMVPARTRRRASIDFSREEYSKLHPFKRYGTRIRAIYHLQHLDAGKKTVDFPEEHERRLLELRKKASKAETAKVAAKTKELLEDPNKVIYSRRERRWLAVEIGTNFIRMTKAERIAALDAAEYKEKSMPINMRKRLGIAFGIGAGLFVLGNIVRGAGAVTDKLIFPLLESISQMSINAMLATAVGIYTLTYAMESWEHARLTREFGTSGNTIVTAMDAAGKRLLTVLERRLLAVTTATAVDFVINTLFVNGIIGGISSGDPKKVIAGILAASVFNSSLVLAGEGVILAHKGLKLLKDKKEDKK